VISQQAWDALQLLGAHRGTLDYQPVLGGFAYAPAGGGYVTGTTVDALEARGLARVRVCEGQTYLVLTVKGVEELGREP
jgi:hypothetical protein